MTETGEVHFLPTEEQQEWLRDALAELLTVRGTRPFLSMPLVEPTPRFFPDRRASALEDLDRITRRLMQYADLADLDVRVGTFRDPGFHSERMYAQEIESAAGLFLGLESDCAFFAINEDAPNDMEYWAGVMGHEVAHAYRAHYGLVDQADRDREEWLTDVTGCYLGFGLLLANNSYRYRTSSTGVGPYSRSRWSSHRVGYLSPQAFAFLLAIQLRARELPESEEKRYLKYLEANQAAFTKAALVAVSQWPGELFQRLQFRVAGARPELVQPESVLAPLPEIAIVGQEMEADAKNSFNRGRPVFRVPMSRAHQHSLVGMVLGMMVGIPLAYVMDLLPIAIVCFVGGMALGWKHGATRLRDFCSDPACTHILLPEDELCPGCGGIVAGSIPTRDHRLAAEEALERQLAKKKRKRSKPRKPVVRERGEQP